jgi:putative transposase
MLLFHVWFSTKYRREALQDERREFVLACFNRIAEDYTIDLLEAEAQFDHVHMLLRVADQPALSRTMMLLKGISARQVFEKEPELRLSMGSLSFWQKKYGWRQITEEKSRSSVAIFRLRWNDR